MISKATPKSTCLQESEDGPSPSATQDGPNLDLFGQPVVRAPRSAQQAKRTRALNAKAKCLCGALDELALQYAQTATTHGLPMPATYGQKCGGLQPSADLNTCLVSKLWSLEGRDGFLVFEHQWKSSATLLGLEDYRLHASKRPISDSAASSWPTPMAGKLTPQQRGDFTPNLPAVAQLAGWMTPRGRGDAGARKGQVRNLEDQAAKASWPTPTANRATRSTRGTNLVEAARMASGVISNGSPAETEKPALLNPEFTRWLMGFPEEWACYAPSATPSSHK